MSMNKRDAKALLEVFIKDSLGGTLPGASIGETRVWLNENVGNLVRAADDALDGPWHDHEVYLASNGESGLKQEWVLNIRHRVAPDNIEFIITERGLPRGRGNLAYDGYMDYKLESLHLSGPKSSVLLTMLIDAIYGLGSKMRHWDPMAALTGQG